MPRLYEIENYKSFETKLQKKGSIYSSPIDLIITDDDQRAPKID